MEWLLDKINKLSKEKLDKIGTERFETEMKIKTVKSMLDDKKITASDIVKVVEKSKIKVNDKKEEKKVGQEIAKEDLAKAIKLDEVLGETAITNGIKNYVKLGQKDLSTYLDNNVIQKILENKNFYKKYKESLQIRDWIDGLLKIPMNNNEFSKKLGQAGSNIRDLLYKSKKHKLEAWLAIFGPARRQDKTSKNIDKINEALEKKINRIVKHLKHGFWEDYSDMTMTELQKLFGSANSLYEFLKNTLKIDITVLPLVLLKSESISIDIRLRFLGILNRFIEAKNGGSRKEDLDIADIEIDLTNGNVSPIQAAKRLRNKMKKVCSIDLTGIKGQLEDEDDPELETNEAIMDRAKTFLSGIKASIEDPGLKSNVTGLEKAIKQVQNNPTDEEQKQKLLKEELELYKFLEDKENVEKLEGQIQVKELLNNTKEIFPNNKEIKKETDKLSKLMDNWDFSKDAPKT